MNDQEFINHMRGLLQKSWENEQRLFRIIKERCPEVIDEAYQKANLSSEVKDSMILSTVDSMMLSGITVDLTDATDILDTLIVLKYY